MRQRAAGDAEGVDEPERVGIARAGASQMTEEGGLYVLDKTSKKLRSIDLEIVGKPLLKRVQ